MSGYAFRFAGHYFIARGSGALYWPGHDMLVVADLHLGKSERMARRGGALLPPFETRETLSRLVAELDAVRPARLILLGDIHDDDAAAEAMDAQDRSVFELVINRQETTLLAGNHDLASGAEELFVEGLHLRHIAGEGRDISGHYHPKARLAGRARHCFLVGADHLILPAFGHYTGGLRCDDQVLRAIIPKGLAILTGKVPLAIPVGSA